MFSKWKEQSFQENDRKVIDQIRSLGLDMIMAAQSGHPGIVLGAAPIIYTLYKVSITLTQLLIKVQVILLNLIFVNEVLQILMLHL